MMGKQIRFKYLIGIDEVGRGSLAGPVVVAGVRINSKRKAQSAKLFKDIKDSKKLTPRRREGWFEFLTKHPKIKYAVAQVWPRVIDRINIAKAANLGAKRVYQKLSSGGFCGAVLDGSLYLPKRVPQETIIRGDEKIPAIAAASIIAKVTRDRLMQRLHKKYPQYGFDHHKGYGTRKHYEALDLFAPTKLHRLSFLTRFTVKR